MSKPIVITSRIDSELTQALDKLAARLKRSRAWVVEQAVARYVEEESEFWAFIQEGVDAADRGELVSQEEMEAWFESRRHRAVAE
ncbi:ribbon-helix-helix protein, CopG family [Sphingomonas sp. dw_22]|uniref:CopG family ribbon-helix-helix protein n=1 Tax=Sphingomonas sp. dw_22 TaxID=2721175 RepID=UPI001BD309FD|nr:ribbon-helix-helix protein, CopG family [Sphingomonas sp. dw_22]